jgi:hypothetical protein
VNLALFIFSLGIVHPCLENLTGKADDFLSPLLCSVRVNNTTQVQLQDHPA